MESGFEHCSTVPKDPQSDGEEDMDETIVLDKDGFQDILGSGAVRKKVVREGHGDPPEYKQMVFVHYVGKLARDGTVFVNTYDGDGPVLVTVGDQILEEVVPGLMLAIRMMKTGEICDVKCSHRFAYAHYGLQPHVKPDEDVEFRVELVRIGEVEKEPVEMTPDELVECVRRRKERGNDFFKMGRMEKAIQCYQDGLKKSESHLPPGTSEENPEEPIPLDEYNTHPELITLKAQCAGNVAACFEKQEKWKEAKDACVAVLSVDPTNLKALLRAARVASKQGLFNEATMCLKTAREAHPESQIVAKEIKQFKKVVEEYKEKKKSTYGGFLEPAATAAAAGAGAVDEKTSDQATNVPQKQKQIQKQNLPHKEKDTDESPIPEGIVENEKDTQITSKKLTMIERVINLIILTAPMLLSILILTFFPVVKGDATNVNAQKVFTKLGYPTLPCEGFQQSASCCVCKQMMMQIHLRQEVVREKFPGRMVQIGFRMDNSKPMIPYEQSEPVLEHILERICERLPVDIPKSVQETKQLKVAIKRSCLTMMDDSHEDILALLRKERDGYLDVCTDIVPVCEKQEPWQSELAVFGHERLACDVCTSAVQTLLKEEDLVYDKLRGPGPICAKLQIALPRSEKRVKEISQAIGNACIKILYGNRKLINETIASTAQEGCTVQLQDLLCGEICN